jgi:hypothetical protein
VRYRFLFYSFRGGLFAVANKDEIDAANVEDLLQEIVDTLALAVSQVQSIAEDTALIDGVVHTLDAVAAVANTAFDVS